MAITQSVVSAVAERLPGRRVARIRLAIGPLSGVVADAVRFCFDLVTQGTSLEGAVLEIEEPPGRIRCRSCQQTSEVTDLVALCPCGSADVEVVSGDELIIREVQVAR